MTKRIIAGIVGASTSLLAGHARAADTIKVPMEIEVGAEYHFQLMNTDDALKADGSRVKETDFATKAAKLNIRGKLTDQISWTVLYQADNNLLERYYLTNKVTDTLEVTIGKQKIKTYGWNRKLAVAWNSPIRSSIQSVNPLTDKLAIDVTYKMFGTWSLALVKDYFDPSALCQSGTAATATTPAVPPTCKSWNAYEVEKQPAIVFDYSGSFGEWQPLIQYASYDRNHSWTGSAGLRWKNEMVDAYVDYIMDERNDRAVTAAGKSEDRKNKTSGVVVHGEFFAGTWTPYALFSTTNLDEYTAPSGTEIKTNKDGAVNDNERIYALGTFYEGWGNLYRPYVGVAATSGKYVGPKSPKDEETRTKTDVMVGLTGKF